MKAQEKLPRPPVRPADDKRSPPPPPQVPRKVKREPLQRARPGRDRAIVKVES